MRSHHKSEFERKGVESSQMEGKLECNVCGKGSGNATTLRVTWPHIRMASRWSRTESENCWGKQTVPKPKNTWRNMSTDKDKTSKIVKVSHSSVVRTDGCQNKICLQNNPVAYWQSITVRNVVHTLKCFMLQLHKISFTFWWTELKTWTLIASTFHTRVCVPHTVPIQLLVIQQWRM